MVSDKSKTISYRLGRFSAKKYLEQYDLSCARACRILLIENLQSASNIQENLSKAKYSNIFWIGFCEAIWEEFNFRAKKLHYRHDFGTLVDLKVLFVDRIFESVNLEKLVQPPLENIFEVKILRIIKENRKFRFSS